MEKDKVFIWPLQQLGPNPKGLLCGVNYPVCLFTCGMHASVCILYMSTSVSRLCRRVSVVHCMCVGMGAYNVFCCVRVVANRCPLTETSTCAKMSREGGREGGGERADTMR